MAGNADGALGSSVGTRTITVNDTATLSLTANNVFGGNGRSLADTPKLIINSGGTVTNSKFTVIGNVDLNGGTLRSTGGDSTSWRSYEFNGSTITVGGTTASTISGSGTNSQMHIAGDKTLTLNVGDVVTGTDLTISAILRNGSNDRTGNGALTKTGEGTAVLSGANTYSGLTKVDNGTLTVSGTLQNTSGFTVNAGATGELNGSNIFTGGHGTAMDNSRVLTANNGGILLMNTGMISRIGNVTLNNGSTWTSNQGLTNYDVLLANTGGTGAGAATVSVTGNAASTMNGTGGMHLQGVQNFAVADVTSSSATDLTVSMILGDPGTTGGAAGGINKTGAGTMAIATQTAYTGGTTVSNGVLDLTGGGGASGTIRGTATVNTGATLRLSTNDSTGYNNDATRLSVINLVGGELNVNTTGGAGQNQTFRGTINMTGGSITGRTGSTFDLFGNGSAINTIASGTTSTISGTSLGLRQDNSTFNVAKGTTTSGVDLLVNSALTSGSSTVEGNHNFIKAGAGTMALTGTNTYTGTTSVNAGTLVINGSTAAGAVTVASGATLAGSGTVGGATTIQSGGIHGPGNSPGVQTFNSTLTYADASIFSWDLDTSKTGRGAGNAYDGVNVNQSNLVDGGETGGSIFRIVLEGSQTFADTFWDSAQSWSDIFKTQDGTANINWTTIFPTFEYTNANGTLDPSTQGTFTYTSANTLTWSAVPEPTSALAGLLLGAGLLRRRRVA